MNDQAINVYILMKSGVIEKVKVFGFGVFPPQMFIPIILHGLRDIKDYVWICFDLRQD